MKQREEDTGAVLAQHCGDVGRHFIKHCWQGYYYYEYCYCCSYD